MADKDKDQRRDVPGGSGADGRASAEDRASAAGRDGRADAAGSANAAGRTGQGSRADFATSAMDAANRTIDEMMSELNRTLGASPEGGSVLQDVFGGITEAGKAIGKGISKGVSVANSELSKWLGTLGQQSYERYLAPLTVTTGPNFRGLLVYAFALFISVPLALVLVSFIAIGSVALAVVCGLMLAASILFLVRMGPKGKFEQNVALAYTTCRPILLRQPAITVEELATRRGIKQDRMVTYLEEFIRRDWTPQGHLSDDGTAFLLTDELYEEYEERRREEQAARGPADDLTEEQRATLARIQASMEDVEQVAQRVGDEARRDVERTVGLARQIEAEARRHPDAISKLGLFSTYYLPTTARLIGAYAEIAAKPAPTSSEKDVAARILASLEQINGAFQTLLDSMSATRTLDIESDLDALETMMRQDGLTK